jgi:hypothetical protein
VLERLDPNSPGIQQSFQGNSLDWGTGFTRNIEEIKKGGDVERRL